MKQTGNYKLNKPEGTSVINIEDLNANMDILDAEVAKKLELKDIPKEKGLVGSKQVDETDLKDGAKLTFSKSLNKWVAKTPPDDTTSAPGPKYLIGGDVRAGFFGFVPASELFTGTELASEVGITEGVAQFNDVPWLKFAVDGKIIFKSQKSLRHSVSWDHINGKGCVYGDKAVIKNGTKYSVRLMRTGTVDPMVGADGVNLFGSEWNRLMYPISIYAKTDSGWYKDENVKKPTPYWGVNLTNEDLGLLTSFDGRYQWCQEENPGFRLTRGGFGVSFANIQDPGTTQVSRGWSPVLEVIE